MVRPRSLTETAAGLVSTGVYWGPTSPPRAQAPRTDIPLQYPEKDEKD